MKDTRDSDIFILNLEVTSLKILIRLLYHLSFPESSMLPPLQKVFSYWTFIDRIQINAYFNRSWNFHYFIQNQESCWTPSIRWILKHNKDKLDSLIRKLLDHLPPRVFLAVCFLLNIFFLIHRWNIVFYIWIYSLVVKQWF